MVVPNATLQVAGWISIHLGQPMYSRTPATYFLNADTMEEHTKPTENDYSGLIAKIKNFLYEYYTPVDNPKDADLHLTTREIYEKLLGLFPSVEQLPESEISLWLHNGGYSFYDFGEMRLEWLFKKS